MGGWDISRVVKGEVKVYRGRDYASVVGGRHRVGERVILVPEVGKTDATS